MPYQFRHINGNIEKIHTNYDPKPIPVRVFDWTAVTENYDGSDPIGHGETEEMAIIDLVAQFEDENDELQEETERKSG